MGNLKEKTNILYSKNIKIQGAINDVDCLILITLQARCKKYITILVKFEAKNGNENKMLRLLRPKVSRGP